MSLQHSVKGKVTENTQHFRRPRQADHLRSGVQDHPGQYGETLPLLKIQKLAWHDGGLLLSQSLMRLRQENHLNLGGEGFSEPRSTGKNSPENLTTDSPMLQLTLGPGPSFLAPGG